MAGTRPRAPRRRRRGPCSAAMRALALGAVAGGQRARVLERRGAAEALRGGRDAVDQREHAGARGLLLAAVEVEQRAGEAVAQRAPAVVGDADRVVHRQRLAGVVALGQPARRARRRARARRPPPRRSSGRRARAARSSPARRGRAPPTTARPRRGRGRRGGPTRGSRRTASHEARTGGTPWRGSRPAISGRSEARPVSRPACSGALPASAARSGR